MSDNNNKIKCTCCGGFGDFWKQCKDGEFKPILCPLCDGKGEY